MGAGHARTSRNAHLHDLRQEDVACDSDWTPVTDANKDQYHFFKVEVKMK